jgi:hypothetical protein
MTTDFAILDDSTSSRKRQVLVAAVALAIVNGLLTGLTLDGGGGWDVLISLVVGISSALLILTWCYFDSLQTQRRFGAGFRILVILLGPLALWIYLARARSPMQALRAIVLSTLFILALLILSGIIAAGLALVVDSSAYAAQLPVAAERAQ